MTTMRYGLGYNKDGVLGVAGLLGSSSGGSFLGFSFIESDTMASGVLSQGYFFGAGDTEPTLTEALANVTSSYTAAVAGNGIHAYGLISATSYIGPNTPQLSFTKDGIDYTPVTDISTDLVLGNDYNNGYYILTGLVFASGKFHLTATTYYQGSYWLTKYFTTTDFVQFSTPVSTPVNGFPNFKKYSGLGYRPGGTILVHPSNGGIMLISPWSTSYYSADGSTWTGISMSSTSDIQFLDSGVYAMIFDGMSSSIRRMDGLTESATFQDISNAMSYMQSTNLMLADSARNAEIVGDYLVALKYDFMMGNSYSLRTYKLSEMVGGGMQNQPATYITNQLIASSYSNDVGLMKAGEKLYLINTDSGSASIRPARIVVKEVVVGPNGSITLEDVIDYTVPESEYKLFSLAIG